MKAIINLYRFFSEHPLSRDNPLKAWARFVSWQVKSRLHEEVLIPWIEGQMLAVRRGMSGATGNIYVGLHEFVDMMIPLHFLREGDLFPRRWCKCRDLYHSRLRNLSREAMTAAPQTLVDKGKRGRAWMLRDFSWDTIAAAMADVYHWCRSNGEPPACVDWAR